MEKIRSNVKDFNRLPEGFMALSVEFPTWPVISEGSPK